MRNTNLYFIWERINKMIMVTTDRMLIFPISNKEIEMKVREETDEEMKQAYSEMLAGCREKPDQ